MGEIIDKEAREYASLLPTSIVYTKSDKTYSTILPRMADGALDVTPMLKYAGGSGDNPGGDNPENPDNPSAGADYYAGSLADGEITERKLEWSDTDDPTKDLTVTFKDDPGSKPFGQYTGLTFLAHIQKTVVTAGTKGAVSKIELNYDTKNAPKSGYYTTTSPYPFYIKSSDLVAGKKLTITVNGIGENLGGKSIKEPSIDLTYNSDRTMTIVHTQGYENDGAEKPTGSTYDLVIDTIATFSTQAAVAQLPSSINLFTGSTDSDAVLAGAGDYYENVMDGIELTFGDIIGHYNTSTSADEKQIYTMDELKLPNPIRISKKQLIEGLTVSVFNPADFHYASSKMITNNSSGDGTFFVLHKLLNNELIVKKGSLSINITAQNGWATSPALEPANGKPISFNLIKVTPYKN